MGKQERLLQQEGNPPRLLIVILSPRDMKTFKLAMDRIKHDKIWVKYVGYNKDPYGQWLQYLSEHPEYTHIAICPDDLMIHPHGVKTLWKRAKETNNIISGCINVDKNTFDCPYRTSWPIAATKNLPDIKFPRYYDWYTWGELQKQGDIVEVIHTGTPFVIIPRDIVFKISFQGDRGALNPDKPSAYDVGISHDLVNQGIKQYVDTTVFFAHFRYGAEIQNGKKEPHLIIEKDGRTETKPLYELVPFAR